MKWDVMIVMKIQKWWVRTSTSNSFGSICERFFEKFDLYSHSKSLNSHNKLHLAVRGGDVFRGDSERCQNFWPKTEINAVIAKV